jgi:putative PIN family toxin of toxin-antitoxin system
MRLVLDTDVVVAAFRSETGASRQLLLEALDGACVLLASTPLWLEYEAVLTREDHLRAARLTPAEVRDALSVLAEIVEPVVGRFRWRASARDADDDFVVEAVANGKADAIVTFNRKDFAGVIRQFGAQVLSPAEVLRELR